MITIAAYVHWEVRRYLLAIEAPGKFGTYGQEDAK